MPSTQQSFYLLNAGTICAIFLHWMLCIDGFGLFLQRYIRKGSSAKNPAILCIFCCYQKHPVKHMCSKSKYCDWIQNSFLGNTPILEYMYHSFEFYEIWHKNTLIGSFFETHFKIKTSRNKIWQRFDLSEIIFKSKKS